MYASILHFMFKPGSLVKHKNSYESTQYGTGIVIQSVVDPLDGLILYDVLFGNEMKRVHMHSLEKIERKKDKDDKEQF